MFTRNVIYRIWLFNLLNSLKFAYITIAPASKLRIMNRANGRLPHVNPLRGINIRFYYYSESDKGAI